MGDDERVNEDQPTGDELESATTVNEAKVETGAEDQSSTDGDTGAGIQPENRYDG